MQFQKGQSGNPAGRPRGSQNKASIRMQEMLEQKADELVDKLVELAMAGNIGALRLCLDRIVPTRNNEPLPCAMPPLAKAADAVAAIAGIGLAKTQAVSIHLFLRLLISCSGREGIPFLHARSDG